MYRGKKSPQVQCFVPSGIIDGIKDKNSILDTKPLVLLAIDKNARTYLKPSSLEQALPEPRRLRFITREKCRVVSCSGRFLSLVRYLVCKYGSPKTSIWI